jgi:NADH-quinone oxidoreductase subunit M
MKKLVAYSSVSHMGFVVLGICAMNLQGLTGAMLQMVNHGLSTGALFLLVGMLYERRHSRNFSDYGGLASIMPRYAFFLVFVACSSMGVPGLNGFVGEFLVLLGVFQANKIWAVVALSALVIIRKVYFH